MVFGEGAEDNTRGRVRSPEKEFFAHKYKIISPSPQSSPEQGRGGWALDVFCSYLADSLGDRLGAGKLDVFFAVTGNRTIG